MIAQLCRSPFCCCNAALYDL